MTRSGVEDRETVDDKRGRILLCAMRLFAEHGYRGAKIEDIATELQIAKGSIFQHFGSKAELFLEAYKRAVTELRAWLDAPPEIIDRGFFAVFDYWIDRTDTLIVEGRVPYRVTLVGNYGSDLEIRRQINRFLLSEDPYGTLEFVEWGQQRGEVRTDVESEVLASLIDWFSNALQDAMAIEELDPGLFHRLQGDPERRRTRIDQFRQLLRSSIEAPASEAEG
jgi:AcrR family transcriptional regulator